MGAAAEMMLDGYLDNMGEYCEGYTERPPSTASIVLNYLKQQGLDEESRHHLIHKYGTEVCKNKLINITNHIRSSKEEYNKFKKWAAPFIKK